MTKRAVLVGINRYQIPGADLRGCVNDVKNVKRVLTRRFGFPASRVVTLLDLQATKKRIEAAVTKLIRDTKPGDVAVFHYSGHGSYVPDDNNDESDRRDEILCPTDLDWKDPLRDDWLRKTFDGLAEGARLTVIMDCCHSGSNTRLFPTPNAKTRARYLPSPWSLIGPESGRTLRAPAASPAVRRKGDVATVNIPEVLITGCRDTQTSADAHIGGSFNGALTYYLVKAIEESDGAVTFRKLHQRVKKLVRENGYDQVPQLEGRASNLDRPILIGASTAA